jgi:hypothetical protein
MYWKPDHSDTNCDELHGDYITQHEDLHDVSLGRNNEEVIASVTNPDGTTGQAKGTTDHLSQPVCLQVSVEDCSTTNVGVC